MFFSNLLEFIIGFRVIRYETNECNYCMVKIVPGDGAIAKLLQADSRYKNYLTASRKTNYSENVYMCFYN